MTTGAPMRWGRSRVLHSLSGAVSRAFTFVLLAVVLLSFTVAALHPEMTVLEPALSLLLMAAALALHVVVHEAAHSVTALALRMGVPEVQLGQGTPLLRFRLGSTAVKVGGFHSGVTHIEPQSTVLLRTRLALVTAAGPVSNLALAGLAYWLVDPPARGPGSFAYAVVAAGVVLGGFNLLPVKVDTPRGKAETDGRALLSLLGADRRMGEQLVAASRLGAAQRQHAAGEDVKPEAAVREAVDRSDPVILGLEGTRRIFTGEYDEAVTLLREAVSRRQKDETRANSLNNLAWALLLARPDGWLDEADRASAEAIALRPKTEAMSSTRGCVLVHRGDHAQARPLLMTALKAETAPQDGQILQSHLLQAELGLGNLYGAREALLAMMDSGAVEEEVASHRALLRTAEVEHALANLVGADGIIQWPDAGAGEPLGRHLKEMRTALVAFLEEAEDDHRRESVRLALGV